MINIDEIFEIGNEIIAIRDSASPDDLARWIVQCLDHPGAGGVGYEDAPHYNVIVVYRTAHYGRQRELQNIVADLIDQISTNTRQIMGEHGAEELLLLVDPIILHSERIEDVVNSLVSIASTSGRWSVRVQKAALQALLALPRTFGPAFWFEQFERLGPEASVPVMEGLSLEAPQPFVDFLGRVAWSPHLQDAFIAVLGGVAERQGIMVTARTILPLMPTFPPSVAEAVSVFFTGEGLDVFTLMLESTETCTAVLSAFLTTELERPRGTSTLFDMVRRAVERAPALPHNTRSLSGGIVTLLSRFTSLNLDVRALRMLLEVATIMPDPDVIASVVALADTLAVTNSDTAVEANLAVLNTLEVAALQLRALTTRAIGMYNPDVMAMITRALGRMVRTERLVEPAISLAAAHLPLDTLERVVHSHLIVEGTSVAAVAALIEPFHSRPIVIKLLASIWGEAMIEHELDIAARISREYPAIHRSATHAELSGERVLALQDAAAPEDLVKGLLNG